MLGAPYGVTREARPYGVTEERSWECEKRERNTKYELKRPQVVGRGKHEHVGNQNKRHRERGCDAKLPPRTWANEPREEAGYEHDRES